MPATPFISKFPDLGRQTMLASFSRGRPGVPDGHYGFLEIYCDEKGCDCKRVLIAVITPKNPSEFLAMISYNWDDADPDAHVPVLEPYNRQGRYAKGLLNLFRDVLETPGYIEQFQRHYALFKDQAPIAVAPRKPLDANRRKRLRDPRRRGRNWR